MELYRGKPIAENPSPSIHQAVLGKICIMRFKKNYLLHIVIRANGPDQYGKRERFSSPDRHRKT